MWASTSCKSCSSHNLIAKGVVIGGFNRIIKVIDNVELFRFNESSLFAFLFVESILKIMALFLNPIIIFILAVIVIIIGGFENYLRISNPTLRLVPIRVCDDLNHMVSRERRIWTL